MRWQQRTYIPPMNVSRDFCHTCCTVQHKSQRSDNQSTDLLFVYFIDSPRAPQQQFHTCICKTNHRISCLKLLKAGGSQSNIIKNVKSQLDLGRHSWALSSKDDVCAAMSITLLRARASVEGKLQRYVPGDREMWAASSCTLEAGCFQMEKLIKKSQLGAVWIPPTVDSQEQSAATYIQKARKLSISNIIFRCDCTWRYEPEGISMLQLCTFFFFATLAFDQCQKNMFGILLQN